jgi:hypothetical protein
MFWETMRMMKRKTITATKVIREALAIPLH